MVPFIGGTKLSQHLNETTTSKSIKPVICQRACISALKGPFPMEEVERTICWSGGNTSWPQSNHNNVNQLLVHQESTMTHSSYEVWSIKNKETIHKVMASFQLTSLTLCCVFTVGAETELGCPHNTLTMTVQWQCFHRGLLLSLIYIPLPGGLDRVGVTYICNIRINDLSFHDGLKTITKMDIGQSPKMMINCTWITHCIYLEKFPVFFQNSIYISI